jgi:hypothetical protein
MWVIGTRSDENGQHGPSFLGVLATWTAGTPLGDFFALGPEASEEFVSAGDGGRDVRRFQRTPDSPLTAFPVKRVVNPKHAPVVAVEIPERIATICSCGKISPRHNAFSY